MLPPLGRYREAAIFLGAGRALLLQLAHPWIAAAIEQHSGTFANPIGRFHRTFSTVFTMVFGTLAQSCEAARRLHRRHASITGTLQSAAGPFPAGSLYCANEACALRWVHATLAETAVMAYALVLPPLTPEQRERYYAESRLFAALFGIPREHLARDWTAFAAYTEAITQSSTLTVTEHARAMAHRLLAGADTWLPIPAWYRTLTAALLPPRLRDAFALRYGKAEGGRHAAFYPAGSTDLSTLARSASLCGTLSGGRTAACGKNAAGLRRTHVQPILDGSIRSRSADVTR